MSHIGSWHNSRPSASSCTESNWHCVARLDPHLGDNSKESTVAHAIIGHQKHMACQESAPLRRMQMAQKDLLPQKVPTVPASENIHLAD